MGRLSGYLAPRYDAVRGLKLTAIGAQTQDAEGLECIHRCGSFPPLERVDEGSTGTGFASLPQGWCFLSVARVDVRSSD